VVKGEFSEMTLGQNLGLFECVILPYYRAWDTLEYSR